MRDGQRAPDFRLRDHTGHMRTLYEFLSDGPVVLFFYPIASSPICTAQACHFRDLGNEFAAVGAQRIGISTDNVDRQAHFAKQRSFDFPLLSDDGGRVAEQFGVKRGVLSKLSRSFGDDGRTRHGQHVRHRERRSGRFIGKFLPVRRTTFVIDRDGTVLKVVSNELRANTHANQALWFLQNSVSQ
ncbi:peroxiredoxin [Antrihabitans cavernicola]|uniref:thioredoxin-dependent peroxiredoxin n=1 Tax=Antrihabitans cavernicola TaxID=2495913 RepID=A0A5A7SH62_9NOCA|nr:peroxiredoxin [Spelaeibacter cavernicola]KAA0024003.1 peroxiredoxin [Spelaeibacter cavernicola]